MMEKDKERSDRKLTVLEREERWKLNRRLRRCRRHININEKFIQKKM